MFWGFGVYSAITYCQDPDVVNAISSWWWCVSYARSWFQVLRCLNDSQTVDLLKLHTDWLTWLFKNMLWFSSLANMCMIVWDINHWAGVSTSVRPCKDFCRVIRTSFTIKKILTLSLRSKSRHYQPAHDFWRPWSLTDEIVWAQQWWRCQTSTETVHASRLTFSAWKQQFRSCEQKLTPPLSWRCTVPLSMDI